MTSSSKRVSIVGDFGGSNARLALSSPTGITQIQEYTCADFSEPAAVIQAYLNEQGAKTAERAVIAVAGASDDPSRVMFTNGPWAQKPLDFTAAPVDKVDTINDFAAVCYSIATLTEADCTTLIRHKTAPFFPASILTKKEFKADPSRILSSRPERRFVTVGPGTGLGVGLGLVTEGNQFLVVTSEGGHIAFAANDTEELKLKDYLESEHSIIVTAETFASGTGLVTAFNALCKIRGVSSEIKNGGEIISKLTDDEWAVRETADRTLKLFARTLGSCVSSAVLMSNARTVFIGGGVLKKLGPFFDQVSFARSFLSNDLKENNTLLDTPVMVIAHPQPGLAGADFYLKLTAA